MEFRITMNFCYQTIIYTVEYVKFARSGGKFY